MLSESETTIIVNSLNHYDKRLRKLSEDENIPIIINQHIMTEYATSQELRERITKDGLNYKSGGNRLVDDKENRKIILSALKCYLKDIETYTSEISKDLGNVTIASDSLNEEVGLIKKVIQDFEKNI